MVFDPRILSIVEAEGVKACTRTSDRGLLSHFRVVDKAGPLGGAGGRVPRGHVLETLNDGRLPAAVLMTGREMIAQQALQPCRTRQKLFILLEKLVDLSFKYRYF